MENRGEGIFKNEYLFFFKIYIDPNNNQDQYVANKLVILGDVAVGKSSIAQRY